MTLRPDVSPRSEPQTKNESLFPQSLLRAYSLSPKAAWLLIRLPPLTARACWVATPFPSPVIGRAMRPRSQRRSTVWQPLCVARHGYSSVCPFPNACSSGCRIVSIPIASRAAHPRSWVTVTCVARSLAIRSSPNAIGRVADLAMAAGAHVPWWLRSSPAKPRAPTSMASAGSARAPRLTVGAHLDDRNWLAEHSLPYVTYVCFKYFRRFRCMLQSFHLDIAKVDQGMLHMLQVF
jgi:hypothetical protein